MVWTFIWYHQSLIFNWVQHPFFAPLGKIGDFWKNTIIFEKIWKVGHFLSKFHWKYQDGCLQLIQTNFFTKGNFFQFLQKYFIFSKMLKISNLSRDQASKFRNNSISDMKNVLIGHKKVKTQLLRSRGRKKIQKKSYLTWK